ncbi:MAG: DUF1801 domain-containing protein [Candidatus Sphingomonas colombiensis]|nr:DUF1801 domain-containing protein [Sphingomonas sp.]WEK44604.1 MAG: DUF1801 domain-containing protein [Sphingomonas sp.]
MTSVAGDERLFRLSGAIRRDAQVEAWFAADHDGLRHVAGRWFERMLACGADVGALLHDGHPTACVDDAAFGYAAAFSAHVNIGFFHGAALPDPAGLLEGTGKRMRHVKLRHGKPIDEEAVSELIAAAYRDIRSRLAAVG